MVVEVGTLSGGTWPMNFMLKDVCPEDRVRICGLGFCRLVPSKPLNFQQIFRGGRLNLDADVTLQAHCSPFGVGLKSLKGWGDSILRVTADMGGDSEIRGTSLQSLLYGLLFADLM